MGRGWTAFEQTDKQKSKFSGSANNIRPAKTPDVDIPINPPFFATLYPLFSYLFFTSSTIATICLGNPANLLCLSSITFLPSI